MTPAPPGASTAGRPGQLGLSPRRARVRADLHRHHLRESRPCPAGQRQDPGVHDPLPRDEGGEARWYQQRAGASLSTPASCSRSSTGPPVQSAVPTASTSHSWPTGRGPERARPLPAHLIVTRTERGVLVKRRSITVDQSGSPAAAGPGRRSRSRACSEARPTARSPRSDAVVRKQRDGRVPRLSRSPGVGVDARRTSDGRGEVATDVSGITRCPDPHGEDKPYLDPLAASRRTGPVPHHAPPAPRERSRLHGGEARCCLGLVVRSASRRNHARRRATFWHR